MATETEPKKDVYEIITSRIIEQLEQGKVPWKQTWTEGGLPQNLFSKNYYRGINMWLLMSLGYSNNYFLTYKQMKALGGSLKKGEKPCLVVFWKWLKPKEEGKEESVNSAPKGKPILRYYTVFNIEQCEGISEDKIPVREVFQRNNTPIELCEQVVNDMPNRPVIKHKENRAFYSPFFDYVNMPKLKTFDSSESYYDTLFHELVHSTGHITRLNRKELTDMQSQGGDVYSLEELIAEIGACYLASHTGILNNGFENNVAYIQAWLDKLKNDKKFIIYASAKAQKSVDYILNVQTKEQDEVPE